MKFIKIKRIYQNRVLQHTLFWCVSYIFLLRFFANSGEIDKIDYIYTALFHITLIIGVYFNLLILIPRFLTKRKYLAYSVLLVLVIITTAEMNILFFDKLVDHLLPGYYFISYYEFPDILKFVVAYIIITSLIKIAKAWFGLLETSRQYSQLQKEKTENELKALKNQINPHFLFNSLNSIYALALNRSEKAPDIVVKLADIMRYIIYEATDDFVDLKKEIKYLGDYVALQKLRSDERASISFKIEGETENKKIAPLLLFPLLENSFKHGIKGETGNSFVNFALIVDDNKIYCTIENNLGVVDDFENMEYRGIGLNNVRQRLQGIYPNNHQFKITTTAQIFKVELIINLDTNEN